MKWISVGFRYLFILVAVALVAGSISYTMIQFGVVKVREKVIIEQQQNYINTRKRIEYETKGVGVDNPSAAREWLLKRQQEHISK